jgi:beta-glucuronidase
MRQIRVFSRLAGAGAFILLLILSGPAQAIGQPATLDATLELRGVDGCDIPFQNNIPYGTLERQQRAIISLSGLWKKQRFGASDAITLARRDSSGYAALLNESAGRQSVGFDDGAWSGKILPSVENTMAANEKTPEYYEDGVWYRRTFTVPDSLSGKFTRLVFTSVNYVADVWLNGRYLGYHEGGYSPFAFDASNVIRTDTVNVIAVRVDNIAWGTRKDIIPYVKADWFNYTGIIHDVYLEFADTISVIRADVVPLTLEGALRTTVTLWNGGVTPREVSISLQAFEASIDSLHMTTEKSFELAGPQVVLAGTSQVQLQALPGAARAWRTEVSVPAPRLWSPKNPQLYILRVRVTSGGKLLDEYNTQFGVRVIALQGHTFLLNGKPMFFPGIARHEDHPSYGRSLPVSSIYDDMKFIKGLNVNFVRTAHYPNHPYTYLAADRLGLAVMEEIPVWWFDEPVAWTYQNLLRHVHEQMWKEMIFRDYNRPSIFLWSACNECLDQDGRKLFIQTIRQELNTRYPDGRFVSQSAAADRPGPADRSEPVCDVAGWTMYFGVFHGGTYYEGTRDFLANAHAALPSKPILDTEFGYWSSEDMVNQAKQVKVFDSTFTAFNEAVVVDSNGVYHPGGYLMGTTWWCAFDWYTAQNPGGFQSMGVSRMDRSAEKTVAARLRSVYRPFIQRSELVTAVADDVTGGGPVDGELSQNYPNPFNPATTVTYSVKNTAFINLKVYDMLGREVAVLVNAVKTPGTYTAAFDGSSLASGVYVSRLAAGRVMQSRKMLLIR